MREKACAQKTAGTPGKGDRSTMPFRLSPAKELQRIAAQTRWWDVVGFALCQTWNILCVASRDPITYTAPFLDLRWVSFATALVFLVLAVSFKERALTWLQKVPLIIAIAAVSSAGSILGPLSVLFPQFSAVLIYVAAMAVGVGFALLFLVWFIRFFLARDMMGLAISVIVTAVLTYPLANILATDQINQWIAAGIGSALPLVSAAFTIQPPTLREAQTPTTELTSRQQHVLFFRFCLCVLVVVAVVEIPRNLLLGGTALVFYAGVVNLGGLGLKLLGSVWLLSVFDARNARGVSVTYRIAFLLLLGVVLSIPLLLAGDWFAHTLLDISAFFFELIMILVAYEIGVAFGMNPVYVFGLTRIAWGLGIMIGIFVSPACVESIGNARVATIIMGVTIAIMFLFVFRDRDCVDVLSNTPAPNPTSHFKNKCESLARRAGLSDRELEVIVLAAKGRSAARIADDLNVSLATVNSHVHHIYQKLGVHSRQEMIDLIEAES